MFKIKPFRIKPLLHCALIVGGTVLLQGCLAKTAYDIVTLPVDIATKAVDLATTSQSEADAKRGRVLRERDEQIGRLQRRYDEEMEQCDKGRERYCQRARNTSEEMTLLMGENGG